MLQLLSKDCQAMNEGLLLCKKDSTKENQCFDGTPIVLFKKMFDNPYSKKLTKPASMASMPK
ncbi:MAG: hypothetical protein EOM59_04145 [Clostridia bacterium]|nr:hypothetical protein [Clostridia bacterium]